MSEGGGSKFSRGGDGLPPRPWETMGSEDIVVEGGCGVLVGVAGCGEVGGRGVGFGGGGLLERSRRKSRAMGGLLLLVQGSEGVEGLEK